MLGGYNPRDLVAPTLGDVWQLQTGGRAIVIGQGSSLPASTALAGHGACQLNGVKVTHSGYDEKAGRWRTNADCFTQPASVAALDASTLFPPDGLWMGHKVAMPSDIRRSGLFPRFETDAFVHMIESQPVGQDEVTDVLLLNYKGADYIGHKHGPTSPEIAATLSEMDRSLARILQALEERTGGDYLLAVTADHGMPSEAKERSGTSRPKIVDSLHETIRSGLAHADHVLRAGERADLRRPGAPGRAPADARRYHARFSNRSRTSSPRSRKTRSAQRASSAGCPALRCSRGQRSAHRVY